MKSLIPAMTHHRPQDPKGFPGFPSINVKECERQSINVSFHARCSTTRTGNACPSRLASHYRCTLFIYCPIIYCQHLHTGRSFTHWPLMIIYCPHMLFDRSIYFEASHHRSSVAHANEASFWPIEACFDHTILRMPFCLYLLVTKCSFRAK
jgi:hypothetical protein